MHFQIRKPWQLSQKQHTPVEVYRDRRTHRREFLKQMGFAGAGLLTAGILGGCERATDEQIKNAGKVELPDVIESVFPAPRNEEFEYGRAETAAREAAEYTNFYEFSTAKDSWQHVGKFQPLPWTLEVAGLCAKPRTFDLDELYNDFDLEERAYRHRCVETWAMCVPWTGFPLHKLLAKVEPLPSATFVEFETFNRPAEAPGIAGYPDFPWPYREGLTMAEAANELTFLTTGIYGEALPKQHGAPIRIVIPWKYGFKSGKSIVRITLTDQQPATFWNTYNPREYAFEANVEPEVPHPRWSQARERMLGTGETFDTVKFNGYGDYVAKLYS